MHQISKWSVVLLLFAACSAEAPKDGEDVGGADAADADARTDADASPSKYDSPWRGSLYPENWDPADTDEEGRFLHDFSHAGYRNGEELPDEVAGSVVDVTDYGADHTGHDDSTSGIQQAIDVAENTGGGVVYFPVGLYRVDDRLEITSPNVVLRGEGPDASRIFFTRHEGMSHSAHVRFHAPREVIDEVALADDVPAREVWIPVADAAAFEVGDDVELGWTITDEFVADHQMTGVWQAFNGQWQTFFRRDVVDIDRESDPAKIRIDLPTRYDALVLDDGWTAVNRQSYSSGAGHSSTENVFWNTTGEGRIRSLQYGWGYVIGTGPDVDVHTELLYDLGGSDELGDLAGWEHTEPEDFTEGLGYADTLRPQSLYESQRQRRTRE